MFKMHKCNSAESQIEIELRTEDYILFDLITTSRTIEFEYLPNFFCKSISRSSFKPSFWINLMFTRYNLHFRHLNTLTCPFLNISSFWLSIFLYRKLPKISSLVKRNKKVAASIQLITAKRFLVIVKDKYFK